MVSPGAVAVRVACFEAEVRVELGTLQISAHSRFSPSKGKTVKFWFIHCFIMQLSAEKCCKVFIALVGLNLSTVGFEQELCLEG